MRPRPPDRPDAGFTLIEMLLVLVLLPLVVGAVVDVILTAVRNDSVVSGRLSDTQAAQVLSSYFGRDVQGSVQVTTDPSNACGTLNQQLSDGDNLSGGTPELSLDTGTSTVTYWLVSGGEPDGQGAVIRVSCTGAGGATDAVAASLGDGSSPAFMNVDVSVNDGSNPSNQWVPAASTQTVAISAGHGQNDLQQSPGLQIDLVAAPRL
jgi:prepilin-type N-terminal cleavage/methylation domain-containing protein